MLRPAPWLIAAGLCLAPLSSAQALCVYRGELYARTTLEQEFADARWVLRGRVIAAVDNWSDGSLGEDEEPWTLYRVQVVERFKGDSPVEVAVFTYRNSGGFYMDGPREGPHIGGEYLLFLQPTGGLRSLPDIARDGTVVNYSCGQSKAWAEVDAVLSAMLKVYAMKQGLRPHLVVSGEH